jgi:hypothetical protein
LLSAIGWTIDSWQFWCFIGLFWAVSKISLETGRIQGIIDYMEMSEQEQNKLRRLLQEAKED